MNSSSKSQKHKNNGNETRSSSARMGAICQGLLKISDNMASIRTRVSCRERQTLYHVAVKAGLRCKGIRVYDIPTSIPWEKKPGSIVSKSLLTSPKKKVLTFCHCPLPLGMNFYYLVSSNYRNVSLVGSVQYTCPVVPLCIVDASLSHYVGIDYFCVLK